MNVGIPAVSWKQSTIQNFKKGKTAFALSKQQRSALVGKVCLNFANSVSNRLVTMQSIIY
jgi:hypothetical protein